MIRYVLCRHAIGQSDEVEITESEYRGLARDIKALVEVSDVEEKFNAFIDNFFELEKSSLAQSAP